MYVNMIIYNLSIKFKHRSYTIINLINIIIYYIIKMSIKYLEKVLTYVFIPLIITTRDLII